MAAFVGVTSFSIATGMMTSFFASAVEVFSSALVSSALVSSALVSCFFASGF
jgi:hypothetical protein